MALGDEADRCERRTGCEGWRAMSLKRGQEHQRDQDWREVLEQRGHAERGAELLVLVEQLQHAHRNCGGDGCVEPTRRWPASRTLAKRRGDEHADGDLDPALGERWPVLHEVVDDPREREEAEALHAWLECMRGRRFRGLENVSAPLVASPQMGRCLSFEALAGPLLGKRRETMTSKQVVDRARASTRVTTTVDANLHELAAGLAARFAPVLLPGETMPDMTFFVALAARLLTHAHAQLDEADRAHEAELSDDPAARAERDAAAAEVRETVTSLRSAVISAGGSAAARALSIPSRLPSDVSNLERYAAGLHSALLDPTRVVVNTSRAGIVLDRRAMAATLEPELTRLQAALKNVAKEAAELGVTQTAKDKAIEANDRTFTGVANVIEGLLTLANREDLADRVRPSRRRPGTIEDEGEEG